MKYIQACLRTAFRAALAHQLASSCSQVEPSFLMLMFFAGSPGARTWVEPRFEPPRPRTLLAFPKGEARSPLLLLVVVVSTSQPILKRRFGPTPGKGISNSISDHNSVLPQRSFRRPKQVGAVEFFFQMDLLFWHESFFLIFHFARNSIKFLDIIKTSKLRTFLSFVILKLFSKIALARDVFKISLIYYGLSFSNRSKLRFCAERPENFDDVPKNRVLA